MASNFNMVITEAMLQHAEVPAGERVLVLLGAALLLLEKESGAKLTEDQFLTFARRSFAKVRALDGKG